MWVVLFLFVVFFLFSLKEGTFPEFCSSVAVGGLINFVSSDGLNYTRSVSKTLSGNL